MQKFAISRATVINALTANAETVGMESVNLLDWQPQIVWRSNASLTPYLVIDLGTAQTINRLALLFCNVTAVATMRVRAAPSQANLTAAPIFDQTGLALPGTYDDGGDKHAICRIAGSISARWWRIDLSDAGNTAGYIESGRLWLGKAFEPAFQPNWSPTEGYDENTGLFKYSCQFTFVSETEYRSEIKPLLRDYGFGPFTTTEDSLLIPRHPDKLILAELPTLDAQYSNQNIIYGVVRGRDSSQNFRDDFRVRLNFTAMRG